MSRALITPEAAADLTDIAYFIAQDNPDRAKSFTREIVAHCHRLANTPHAGRPRPEPGPAVRSIPHGQYVIFYRLIEAGTEILHIKRGLKPAFLKIVPREGMRP